MTLPQLLGPLFLNTGSGHCWPWEGGRKVFRRGRIPQRGHSVCQGACSGCTCLICYSSVIQLETDTKVKKATVCLLLTKPNNQLTSRPSVTLCSKTPLTMIVCLRRVRGLLSARLVKIQNKPGVDNYPGRPNDQRGGGGFWGFALLCRPSCHEGLGWQGKGWTSMFSDEEDDNFPFQLLRTVLQWNMC